MKLQVHLRERLLGVPHLVGGLRDQAIAMPCEAAQRAQMVGRAEAATQQPHAVKILQPLAVKHIALAPWEVAHMPRIDQDHLDARLGEQLGQTQPIKARALHGDTANPALHKPLHGSVQVRRKSRKGPDLLGGSPSGHTTSNLPGPNIHPGDIRPGVGKV